MQVYVRGPSDLGLCFLPLGIFMCKILKSLGYLLFHEIFPCCYLVYISMQLYVRGPSDLGLCFLPLGIFMRKFLSP